MAKRWSVPSPPTSGRECVLILDRSAGGFLAFAGALIAAGCAGAAVNSTAPFGHGSWLAAERERCDEECADRSVLTWERVVGLAASVVIGRALADAAPGVWL